MKVKCSLMVEMSSLAMVDSEFFMDYILKTHKE